MDIDTIYTLPFLTQKISRNQHLDRRPSKVESSLTGLRFGKTPDISRQKSITLGSKQKKKGDKFAEDKESLLLRLSKEIINASEGLKNLLVTYKHDSLINSQIQLLLDKIRIKVEKINKALNVKWIIDKEYQSGSNYGS